MALKNKKEEDCECIPITRHEDRRLDAEFLEMELNRRMNERRDKFRIEFNGEEFGFWVYERFITGERRITMFQKNSDAEAFIEQRNRGGRWL